MKTCLLILLLFFPLLVSAQSFTVRGVVRAKAGRAALPGVTVVEKGTANGTPTDVQGRFTLLTTGPAPRLVVSYIGYVSQEVAITQSIDSLVVLLAEDVKSLNEVVVVGYAAPASKRSLGYFASSVPARPVKGRLAGVSIASDDLRTDKKAKAAHPGPRAGAGILTAGEINDFSKWTLWPDIAQKDLSEWRQHWQISPLERYAVQLVTEDGFPVVGGAIFLKDGRDSLLWQAQSDNTGKGELWNNLFAAAKGKKAVSLQAVVDGKSYAVSHPTPFPDGINIIRVKRPCQAPSVVDIAFVVDATGSMGDEIQYLQAELQDVIAQAKDSLASSTINLGSVFYRDAGDAYVTRKTDISARIQQTIDFIGQQRADGGGDFPEAVDEALAVAVNELSWTSQAKARLLFLILDAPPHENPAVMASLQQSIQKAAAKGIRIIPIAASGIDKSTEYLMRSMALATNGTYVFLTDDSGVGDAHIKPTTDKFDVERLNTLLVRLISRYAYTADCRAVKARKAGALTADTVAVKSTPARRGNGYSWKCYPNPTPDILHVELEGEVKELFVTDVTGKIVLRAVPAQHKAAIQMGSFPTGIYFLKFFTGTKWEQAKFLVSR
ncbi:carboxypeptidase-like regulatory domain-containing protein [Hymenobacter sp. ASUV-10]|uniref:Carboxypeptidase-like regulatory domain-containing protein n=1 Tax=Hymenobacter aranciens TaxID=3063996 RepID=A0ABT9BHS2_9BACT|nr:carboxypeptidase-like regulatory domain-containing protein [Hymenobacter sp. ASUV-10]MDO7877817.1 carboxypeptidase-like regulatory domain-containing protein [Hymenobacter sp. ASUV-10]